MPIKRYNAFYQVPNNIRANLHDFIFVPRPTLVKMCIAWLEHKKVYKVIQVNTSEKKTESRWPRKLSIEKVMRDKKGNNSRESQGRATEG